MKLSFLSACLTACSLVHASPTTQGSPLTFAQLSQNQAPGDYFSGHTPSPHLKWYDCYSGLQCARLEVPFDYTRPDGKTFAIALVKAPAKVKQPKQRKGAIFLANGVGDGAGVDFVTAPYFFPNGSQGTTADAFQSGGLAAFDIIGLDGRGSGHTTPSLRCFKNTAAAVAFNAEGLNNQPGLGVFNDTYTERSFIVDNINVNRAYNREWIAGCKKYSSHILPYMSTADNVRDLNKIFKLVKGQSGGEVVFWGYQYATYIGQMFAAMYPSGFDKMYLDGVVQAQYNLDRGDNYPSSIQDATKTRDAIFDSCAASHQCETPGGGSDFGNCCDIYEPTSAAVKARYEAVVKKLKAKVFVSKSTSPGCGNSHCVFPLGTFRGWVEAALEFPALPGLPFAPIIATAVYEIEQGDIIPGGGPGYYNSAIVTLLSFGIGPFDAFGLAVQCLDQRSAISSTARFKPYLRNMIDASWEEGGEVATSELACVDFDVQPANPFTGSFALVRTPGSILFGSNTADPLTPLANGEAMSSIFTDAGLLTLNTIGFTSLTAGSSQCASAFRAAFVNGDARASDAFCDDVVGGPFNVPIQKDYRN